MDAQGLFSLPGPSLRPLIQAHNNSDFSAEDPLPSRSLPLVVPRRKKRPSVPWWLETVCVQATRQHACDVRVVCGEQVVVASPEFVSRQVAWGGGSMMRECVCGCVCE